MKRYLFPVNAALLLLFTLSCSADRGGNHGYRLIIPAENDIQTLNPTVLSDPFTTRIVWQMYEGLLGLDADGNPEPVLASAWYANDDHTVWTFTIRNDVFFHTSELFGNAAGTRPVNASDVEASYLQFARGFGSFVFSGLVEGFDAFLRDESTGIDGFMAVNDSTFRVSLTRSDPSFIYRITSPYLSVMPKEVFERVPDELGETVHIGTGPFRFDRRTATEVYLERNPGYWAETSGNVKELVFRVEKNQQLRITQFRNGQYTLMQLPVAVVRDFMEGPALKDEYARRFTAYETTTYNVHYLGIDNNLIADTNLRRAIASAIDRESIVNRLLDGRGIVATSPVVPGMQGYIPPQGLIYDPDAAIAYLAESNYNGDLLRLHVSDAPNSEQIGLVIQSDLQKAGINVELVRLDFNSLITRLFSENRPELFLMFSEWIFSAPEHILNSYESSNFPNPNLFGYKNSEVDTLIEQLSTLSDREDLNELNYRIEEIALSEAPAVWLYHQNNSYLMDQRMNGFSVNGHNHWLLADVYFD